MSNFKYVDSVPARSSETHPADRASSEWFSQTETNVSSDQIRADAGTVSNKNHVVSDQIESESCQSALFREISDSRENDSKGASEEEDPWRKSPSSKNKLRDRILLHNGLSTPKKSIPVRADSVDSTTHENLQEYLCMERSIPIKKIRVLQRILAEARQSELRKSFSRTSLLGDPGPETVSHENPEKMQNIQKKCRESRKNAENPQKIQEKCRKSKKKCRKSRKNLDFFGFSEFFSGFLMWHFYGPGSPSKSWSLGGWKISILWEFCRKRKLVECVWTRDVLKHPKTTPLFRPNRNFYKFVGKWPFFGFVNIFDLLVFHLREAKISKNLAEMIRSFCEKCRILFEWFE